jgi:hypothetical protein
MLEALDGKLRPVSNPETPADFNGRNDGLWRWVEGGWLPALGRANSRICSARKAAGLPELESCQ